MGQKPIDWTPERVRMLGTMSDASVARHVGCSRGRVTAARQLRQITAYAKGVDWSRVPDLGEMPDAAIAARLCVDIRSVSAARLRRGLRRGKPQRKWVRWRDAPELGVLPDSVVAELYDVAAVSVRSARARYFLAEATICTSTIPITAPLRAAVQRLYPRTPLHVALFLLLARATEAHDIDRP